MISFIEGGVCSPAGFTAAGLHCGIRKNKTKKDIALVLSDRPAAAAAVYTQNLVQGAPILVTKEHLANGQAQAMICNSGIANTCNADGMAKAHEMCTLTASALGIAPRDVIVASTGVIGQPLPIEPIAAVMPALAAALSPEGGLSAAESIMTTDTVVKSMAVRWQVGDQTVTIGGMAKGSGMINPNMATMLCFLTTDIAVEPAALKTALKAVADQSFNRVSVDGDTSTNDMLSIMANGVSGVFAPVGSLEYDQFCQGLAMLCVALARLLAKDGEGATKLLECAVSGAPSIAAANQIADAVINSPLVKTAMFGGDANWGRILCAAGYAGVPLDISRINIWFRSAAGAIQVCSRGIGLAFSEEQAAEILRRDEIIIDVRLGQGLAAGSAWGCDLSYDYVKINGDYRT